MIGKGKRFLARMLLALEVGLALLAFFRRPSSEPKLEPEEPDPSQIEAPPETKVDKVRRGILILITGGIATGIAAIVATPVVAFLVSPLVKKTPSVWRDVGAVNDFPANSTTKVAFEDPSPVNWAGVASQEAAWLRRVSDSNFIAFSINCTHLGCPIRWLPDARLFMCPCHGGVFYADGTVAGGPPKRPLVRHDVRVVNGRVEIQTHELELTGEIIPGVENQ